MPRMMLIESSYLSSFFVLSVRFQRLRKQGSYSLVGTEGLQQGHALSYDMEYI